MSANAILLDRFFRRIEVRDELSENEKNALMKGAGAIRTYEVGADLVKEGDRPQVSTLLLTGLASRYNITDSGRRQITAFHVPGDFVDLHSFPLRTMDHSVGALTRCEVVQFPHSALREITEQHPHLARLLWMLTLLDGAIHRRWLFAMGRMPALEHFAHLVCETYVRLEVVGLAADHQMRLPLTQNELSDMLGISSVHTNRVLQDLRSQGLLIWDGEDIRIPDWPRLAEVAQFNDAYLFLEKIPR
jgi:CRP-like cAMP-binding protein